MNRHIDYSCAFLCLTYALYTITCTNDDDEEDDDEE